MIRFEPLTPGPGTAREWLREELSKREYQPSLSERFWQWVQDLFDKVRDATVAAGGFDPVLALAVLVVLVALAAFVLSRLRANPTAPPGERPVFAAAPLSAADHRELARVALERGDWDAAVVESTRALAANLFERGLVAEDAGATAHEISARAGLVFPSARDGLEGAALAFDETRYGDRRADEASAREVAALEQALRTATPAPRPGRGPVPAVPR